MTMAKLTIEELRNALKRLPDWELMKDREAIMRKFQFVDFDAAFAFMTRWPGSTRRPLTFSFMVSASSATSSPTACGRRCAPMTC